MNERLLKQENKNQIIRNELINLATADAKIIEQVHEVDKKIDTVALGLNKIINSSEELKNEVKQTSKKQDETNERCLKMSELLENMKNEKPWSQTKKNNR